MNFTQTQNGILVCDPQSGLILGTIKLDDDSGLYNFHPTGDTLKPEWMSAIGDVITKDMNHGYVTGVIPKLNRRLN